MVCIARFETPYYADPVHTAEQAIESARKAFRWRLAHQIRNTPPIEPMPPPIEPAPVPEPKPEFTWEWELPNTVGHFSGPMCDRVDKFPLWFIRHIKALVCHEFQVTLASLDADLRSVYIVIPRHIAIYLTHQLMHKSTPKLGAKFHRDHTTIIHALKTIPAKIEQDEGLRQRVGALKLRLEQDLAEWRADGHS